MTEDIDDDRRAHIQAYYERVNSVGDSPRDDARELALIADRTMGALVAGSNALKDLLPTIQDKELTQQIKAIEQRLWRAYDCNSMGYECALLDVYLPSET